MSTPETSLRVGPIWLAPGVTRINVMTKWWAAFVTIALLSGSSLLQGYLLTEHLGIPRGQQGTVSGEISFWVEIVAILLFNPFGILADRIGRRPVYLMGMFFIGLGFGLAPFARTYEELLAYRLIFAIGMAASAGTMATLTSDYPREDSRGLMVGVTAIFNTLGTIFIANAVARIPSLMMDRGSDAIEGGTAMYLFAAGMAFVTIVIAQLGLAPGTPVAKHQRPPVARLYKAGFLAMSNPRIALAYAGSFAARSDLVIKGLFFSLWAIQDGRGMGLNPGESMARFGIMFAIMNGVSMVSAPIFGWCIDRMNRVTAMIIALVLASGGYLSMYIITSPLDFAMAPYFIVISLGSSFMMKSTLSLIGQEAKRAERGSVLAMFSMCGALGILVFTKWGGVLFDEWGPWAPFVLAGAYQSALLVVALVIRVVSPGRDAPRSFRKKPEAAVATGQS